MGPPAVAVALVREQVSVYRGAHHREDVVCVLLVGTYLADVSDHSQARLVAIQIDVLIEGQLLLEVVGQFEQRNVVVVLLGHELDYSFLRTVGFKLGKSLLWNHCLIFLQIL